MQDLEREVLEYLRERNWHKLRPSDLAKSISIEAAELLEIFQWTDVSIGKAKKDPEKMAAIRNELADVFIYCFEMAALLGIDSKKMVRDKLEAAREKYPATLIRELQGKDYPGSGEYLKIKEDYRRQKNKGKAGRRKK